jgi:hypothetical protein
MLFRSLLIIGTRSSCAYSALLKTLKIYLTRGPYIHGTNDIFWCIFCYNHVLIPIPVTGARMIVQATRSLFSQVQIEPYVLFLLFHASLKWRFRLAFEFVSISENSNRASYRFIQARFISLRFIFLFLYLVRFLSFFLHLPRFRFVGAEWDFIVLLSLLLHRYALQLRGL